MSPINRLRRTKQQDCLNNFPYYFLFCFVVLLVVLNTDIRALRVLVSYNPVHLHVVLKSESGIIRSQCSRQHCTLLHSFPLNCERHYDPTSTLICEEKLAHVYVHKRTEWTAQEPFMHLVIRQMLDTVHRDGSYEKGKNNKMSESRKHYWKDKGETRDHNQESILIPLVWAF